VRPTAPRRAMPVWFIETFGSADLESTFLWILVMTAPVWLVMIVFHEANWVRRVAQPFILGPLYCLVLFVLIWRAQESAVLPDPFAPVSYESAKHFARHPISFLALFCNLQILNLVVGCALYQKARAVRMRVPVELLLCWLFGAVGLVPFLIRLILTRRKLT
jgi:hypothetical protein